MSSWFGLFTAKPTKTPELKEAESTFTDIELQDIHKQWRNELSCQTNASPPSSGKASARGLNGHHFGCLVGSAWRDLEPLLASQLLRLVADPGDGSVHLEGLIVAKARLERLGEEASLEFTYRMLDVYGDGVRHDALRAAVLSCLRIAGAAPPPAATSQARHAASGGADGAAGAVPTAAAHPCEGGAGAAPTAAAPSAAAAAALEAQVEAICRGALALAAGPASGGGDSGGGSAGVKGARLSYDMYRQWSKRCPALHATLSRVLHRVGSPPGGAAASGGGGTGAKLPPAPPPARPPLPPGRPLVRLPELTAAGKLPLGAALLQPAWVWALSSRLPPALRAEWLLLFSSQRDGKSFNTFFGRVSACPGPTLTLIRDARGALFGGYASQPWARSGSFYGDVSCFIFSLLPALQVFPATGINDNYQWCGVGFSQLPAGLGWGGAAGGSRSAANLAGGGGGGVGGGGHFALYVEPSLDAGMSRPIATYGNCPLASEQLFQIDTLECWLLQPPEEEEAGAAGGNGNGGGGGGVLAKGAQDAALLELAGFKLHSKGLRDEPLEE